MELERYEKWEPVEGITTPAALALINEGYGGLSVTLIFSEILEGLIDKDLRIRFGRVSAYTVYEGFLHTWNEYNSEPAPNLDKGRWENYTFPLLIVKNSLWLRSFSEIQLLTVSRYVHYQFVTLDQTVDVLYDGVPEACWIEPLG